MWRNKFNLETVVFMLIFDYMDDPSTCDIQLDVLFAKNNITLPDCVFEIIYKSIKIIDIWHKLICNYN